MKSQCPRPAALSIASSRRLAVLVGATCLVLPLALAAPPSLCAQPSGGPYGPVARTYAVPKDAAHVYYVAPDGKADANGASIEAPTTLEAAIARVVTGDAIILRGGIYRTGGLELNQGVTIQPYRDEQPILKGTRVATDWEIPRGGRWETLPRRVWRTKWDRLFPQKPADWWRRDRESTSTPLHRFNDDMVFVDGRLLQSAGGEGELDDKSFFIDYEEGCVYIAFDPTNRLVEITAQEIALLRPIVPVHGKESDKKGPVIRGITFTQYARRALQIDGAEPDGPADPAAFGKDVVGTTLENVTITFCSRAAAYLRGDKLTVRNCLISDTSMEGIFVISSSDVLLERNIVRRNNVERITGYFPSAIKIFNQCYRVTCRDNLVVEQHYSNGIWYDVGNVDGVLVNNWVEDAVDGIFFELSKSVVVVGNVVKDCINGIFILNSSDGRVYNNTLVNTWARFQRTTRSPETDHFGWHPAAGPGVDKREGHVFAGNLLVADEAFRDPLLQVVQDEALCGRLTKAQLTRLDGNLYVRRGSDRSDRPLIAWSPVAGEKSCAKKLKTLDELRALVPQFEAHSRYVSGVNGAVLKSPELDNYELVAPLLETNSGADLVPSDVRKLVGWAENAQRLPGAYPAK